MADHPMQPIELAADGVIRFKANKIVRWLSDTHRADLNEIAIKHANGQFDTTDMVQFWQLLGYSVSGYGDLSFIPPEVIERADAEAEKLLKDHPAPMIEPEYDMDDVARVAEFDRKRCMEAAASDLFYALRDMAEWWAYAMDKPPGAQPDADDHKKVEQLAVKAINALHKADPTYVHRLPGSAN